MPSEQKREGGWPKSHFEQNKFDDKKTAAATFQKKNHEISVIGSCSADANETFWTTTDGLEHIFISKINSKSQYGTRIIYVLAERQKIVLWDYKRFI